VVVPDQTGSLRSLAARVGGLTRAAMYDGRVVTAKARETFLSRFLAEVDPGSVLPEAERVRRAEAARKAYFARLALRSAKVRARRKAAAP